MWLFIGKYLSFLPVRHKTLMSAKREKSIWGNSARGVFFSWFLWAMGV